MANAVLWGMLSAFGVFCALWAFGSRFLSGGTGGIFLCPGGSPCRELSLLRRCRMLRELGLLNVPVILVDSSLSPGEVPASLPVEFCSLEQLPARLELERNRLNGTGT